MNQTFYKSIFFSILIALNIICFSKNQELSFEKNYSNLVVLQDSLFNSMIKTISVKQLQKKLGNSYIEKCYIFNEEMIFRLDEREDVAYFLVVKYIDGKRYLHIKPVKYLHFKNGIITTKSYDTNDLLVINPWDTFKELVEIDKERLKRMLLDTEGNIKACYR